MVDAVSCVRAIYKHRDGRRASGLAVKTGMEFSVQSHTVERFRTLFERYADKWDFIIPPIHQVGDQEFRTGGNWNL